VTDRWALVLISLAGACGSAATSGAPPYTAAASEEEARFAAELLDESSKLEGLERTESSDATAEPLVPAPDTTKERARYPGRLDPHVAERTLQQYEPLIQQCYETRKAELPRQSGKLTMFLVVRNTGRVSEAHAVRDTIGSEPLAKCVAQRLRSVVFAPGPTGGSAPYEYAFLFGQ
jgi:hypothetical protein